MACREEKKEINGHDYYSVQWSATKALKMKFRLIKVLGRAFASLVSLLSASETEKGDIISDAVGSLFEHSTPDELFALLKEIVQAASRDGRRITDATFDEVYSDNLKEFYQAVAFVLKLNYSDFFAEKSELIK